MKFPVPEVVVQPAPPSKAISSRSGPAAERNEQRLLVDKLSQRFALILVIAGGVLPRINHIDKSIWSAEAWVCNSVLADSLKQMFNYPVWLQTTPPLFLLLVRWTVHLAGLSVASLRAVPLTVSILALILVAWLSSLTLRTPFAALCTALVALSPPAVVFSKEVKQYSADVAASCLLLLILWMYIERPDRKRYIVLALATAVALWLSYTAVMFVPAAIVAVAAVKRALNGKGMISLRTRQWRTAILAALTSAICISNYWLFVSPNTSPLLNDYWSEGYPQFGQLKDVFHFYAQYFFGMAVYLYIPIGTKDFLKSTVSSMDSLAWWLIAIVTAGIVVLAFLSVRQNQRHRIALPLCLSPLIPLVILNLLHLYPVNSRRLMLFLLPSVSLAIGIVMQGLWDMLSKNLHPNRAALVSSLITSACVLFVFVAGFHSNGWSNYWFEDEDTGGAFRFLKSHVVAQDTIYVHASIEESAKLYFRILRWQPYDVRYGNTGWGCCKRDPEPRRTDAQGYVVEDFKRVLGKTAPKRVWLIFTGRDGYWREIDRDEPQIIDSYLEQIGYRKEREKHFSSEIVEKIAASRTVPTASDVEN